MAEEINTIEQMALMALNGSLDAIGTPPDQKVRLLMLEVYRLCTQEGWGIDTATFLKRASAIHAVLEARDKRDADFQAKQKELVVKGLKPHRRSEAAA